MSEGDRIALGAAAQPVLGLVVGHGLMLTQIGAAIGTGGALILGRLLSRSLFGVRWHGTVTFLTVPALVTGVALLA